MKRDANGKYLDRWVRDDDPHPHVWRQHHFLSLTRRGDAHSLWLFWDEGAEGERVIAATPWPTGWEDWRP